jgi:hypothetical protein
MTGALKVTLELEIGADPICGEVYANGFPRRKFNGYVQLIGVLEALHPQWADDGDVPVCGAAEPE